MEELWPSPKHAADLRSGREGVVGRLRRVPVESVVREVTSECGLHRLSKSKVGPERERGDQRRQRR
jgi:phosphoribosylaminoimidazole-succinocarboxamide synthase